MSNLMSIIKKYGVYVVLVGAIVYNFGATVMNWWTPDNQTIVQIDTVLAFIGLGSIRAKLADAFAGIDLGPVGSWFTGKKTYIIAIATALFNLGAIFFGWTPTLPWVEFVNSLFAALGLGTFANATMTYKAQVLQLFPVAHDAFNKAA